MQLSRIPKAIIARIRWVTHWRCAEPVVVFESDDWGMQRGGNLAAFQPYGELKDFTTEQTETLSSLQSLYDTLESYPDCKGRPPIFTANFITGNPDYVAIEADGFEKYTDIPISADKELLSGWKEGMERQVFYPQYHGRSHYWIENWLKDLQKDVPGARELFKKRQNGGLALLKNANWRYHSEYINWQNGDKMSGDELKTWINTGLKYFEDAFGFQPQSTISPHYLLPSSTLKVLAEVGFRFIQGGNYHILRNTQTGEQLNLNHALGERAAEGMLFLARNVRFEPRPSRPEMGLESAWRNIERCFKANVPVIIDTHRINYTGAWQEESRQALSSLLKRISQYKPHFLTSVELGQAIQNDGKYVDVWSNETHFLQVRDSAFQKLIRRKLPLFNS